MNKQSYNIIGTMSGTSLDGVDFAYINFDFKEDKWQFKLHKCETIAYSEAWIEILRKAVDFDKNQLEELNKRYTKLLSELINNFILRNKISNIDAVCNHGHTILHRPERGVTLQIGNLPEIAKLINQKVVCDFRIQDVKMGGQGAPLVPIGDKILFSDFDYCLNLGGFSNVSFNYLENRIAFDISPVNTVLNFYADKLGFTFDDKGKISKSGNIHESLLKDLSDLDFYKKSFPKSLGFEFVKEVILPLIERHNIEINDKMRTFTEHIAQQIALGLPIKKGKILITGGGAYNVFLIDRIKHYLPDMEIIIPENNILEYKEALIFGFLGVLRLRDEINVLSSVTGAKTDHSSGMIYDF